LIAGVSTLEANARAVDAFVAATIRAMEEIADNPEVGLDAAIAAVPELATAREAQLAILEATVESWSGPVQDAEGLGAIDADGWAASIDYLTTLGLVPNPVTVDDVVEADSSRGDY
jgi:ABC-type nitrate/sulfonate/bicarbonate transport system substrate-binding protein